MKDLSDNIFYACPPGSSRSCWTHAFNTFDSNQHSQLVVLVHDQIRRRVWRVLFNDLWRRTG